MALIKRDSKPTNPETLIMIKLFEKMSDTRAKRYRYFDVVRTVLRKRLEQIRAESNERGYIMDSEIKEGAEPAIRMLQQAYLEIDKEEAQIPITKKPKLTAIQRNRMAVNFLEMMDQPEKFDYFKRFVDNEKYTEMTWRYLTGLIDEEKELEKLKEIHASMLKQKEHLRTERKRRREAKEALS
jgi:hypothetical protein